MQFIKNGPDVPEPLLQAHEDGRVVFFCGAGISYPAKLPGFGGLVSKLFDDLGVQPDAIQRSAINAGQLDIAIGLLENTYVSHRDVVREAIAKILMPDLSASNALETHEALLMLGKKKDGKLRLITTNFDRLFEKVLEDQNLSVECLVMH